MSAAIGMLTQMGIDTVDPVTLRFDYMRENLAADGEQIDANGLRGTRSHDISRNVASLIRVGGPIEFQPNAVEMARLLPWCLGGTPSGSPLVTYPLADTLSSRFVTIDRILKVFKYSGVKVDVATFSAQQGEPLKVTLDLVGQTETVGNAGTFPVLSIDTANGPWTFHQLVYTVNALTITAKNVEIRVNNFIDKERFFNSQTLTTVETHDREITISSSVPYGDWSALYNTGPAGVAATAVFTNGGAILTMSFVKVAFLQRSPNVEGRVEVMMPLNGKAFKSGATLEMVTQLNVGP